ncbi:histidine kinase [Wenyingzhuangia sp. 2_MG-2023]|uniref:histidine kinase n=1 Tax=Wenyingzhuangia sp. 2_MG-2023 TaxID=3062639 RepID=UPI0026E2BFEB|nr:histidine kinase [Wenyingzhuangia sp. 2_MG-2023]MDO6738305.1 histidine kinase [Wenyingzhuangia sp. 2_MG-2023]
MQKVFRYTILYVLIGLLIFIISNSLFGSWSFVPKNPLLLILGFNVLYSFVIGGLNMIYFKLLAKIKWDENKYAKRIVIGVLGSIPVSFLGLFLMGMIEVIYLEGFSFQYFISHQNVGDYVFGLLISLIIVVAFNAFYFFKKFQEGRVKDSQIIAKTETAKFESLKNQLDPHFLFNSLNVLTSLIDENPMAAQKFTTGLSKVYRYILEQKDKDLVLVRDEIKFAKSYMQLLKTRFEEGVEFEISEELETMELKIVPLSLQLLLENAVKHNSITPKKPLNIKIYKENNQLVVQNSYHPKQVLEKSTKVGLENIKQRYALITNEKMEVIQEDNLFIVKLPFLTKNIKLMKTPYLNDSEKYLKAQKRVEELTKFYWGLGTYLVVIPFLIFINYKTFWGYQWFWFPMFGWGMGISIHALKLFVVSTSWQDRKIKELMNKES